MENFLGIGISADSSFILNPSPSPYPSGSKPDFEPLSPETSTFLQCTICDEKLEWDKKSYHGRFQKAFVVSEYVNVRACSKCFSKWSGGFLTAEESRKVLNLLLPLVDEGEMVRM